jgi:hypothetical protein
MRTELEPLQHTAVTPGSVKHVGYISVHLFVLVSEPT